MEGGAGGREGVRGDGGREGGVGRGGRGWAGGGGEGRGRGLGATLITCKSAIMPSAVTFISRIITFADFLPIPFKAVKSLRLVGIFLSLFNV